MTYWIEVLLIVIGVFAVAALIVHYIVGFKR